MNSNFIFDFDIFVFLGLGNPDFSIEGLVASFLDHTQRSNSSPVMILPSRFRQFPDVQECPCKRTLRSLWSSESSLGTIFAQILRIPKSSVMIVQTVSLLMDSSLAIIRTVRRRSALTSCFTCSVLPAILLVEGLPDLWSSSTSLCPSLNRLCHSNTRVHDMALLPYTCCNSSRHCEGVLPSLNKKFQIGSLLKIHAVKIVESQVVCNYLL